MVYQVKDNCFSTGRPILVPDCQLNPNAIIVSILQWTEHQGLDSETALVIIGVLQALTTEAGMCIICSIHQPSSQVGAVGFGGVGECWWVHYMYYFCGGLLAVAIVVVVAVVAAGGGDGYDCCCCCFHCCCSLLPIVLVVVVVLILPSHLHPPFPPTIHP